MWKLPWFILVRSGTLLYRFNINYYRDSLGVLKHTFYYGTFFVQNYLTIMFLWFIIYM